MQRSRIAALLTMLLFLFGARAAFADPRTEKEAKDLRQKAIDEDSLALQYPAAIDKLQNALNKCGANNCSPQLRAQLHQDMGAMIFNNNPKDRERALQSFVDAAKLDASLNLSRDYRTAELDELWGEAKKRAGGGSGGTPEPSNTTNPDWDHTPPAEQQANTPLPIYVKYKGQEKIAKVLVRYKGAQMGGLESAQLNKKDDGGWGGIIPCKDVTEGTLQYYVRAENDAGDQVKLGDPDHMFKVAIKGNPVDNPPSLPGESPPKPCACPPDAPPDFPGCQKKDESTEGPQGKDEGADCDEDSECKSKQCKKHMCTAPSSAPGKFRRVWLGVAGALDLDLLPGANDVCLLLNPQATPANSAGYYCVNPNNGNADYPSRTNPAQNSGIQLGKSDQVKGGFAPGNIRLMVSLDYAFSEHFLLGLRAGYVLNTYPGSAAANDGKGFTTPVHLELRGTYLFGQDALSKPGLSPMALVGAGMGEYDAKVSVTVIDASGSRPVDAWLPNGPVFVTVGGGIRYAFSARAAFTGALKFNAAFGSNGVLPGFAPEIGLQFGL